MKSKIRFSSSYSQSNVIFLDMIVNIHADKIFTSIYSKLVDIHTYLHASLFQSSLSLNLFVQHAFVSLEDFKAQSSKFIDFFVRRGYKKIMSLKLLMRLLKCHETSLLTPKKSLNSSDAPVCAVLSISWHPRLQFLQNV